MFDDNARRSLRQAAKRGGAVSAGAFVVMLAGGSFAVAGSSGGGAAGGLSGTTSDLSSALNTPTALPSGKLPIPKPQPAPLPGPVNKVVTTVTGTADTVTSTVTTTVRDLTSKPGPGPAPEPAPEPGPTDNGTGGTGGTGTHQPPAGTHTGTTTGQHAAGHVVRPSSVGQQARSARLRADALPDNAGNFAEQRTNASVTPGLAPRSADSIFPAADLGGRGVPGVLVVIATAGVAALGASHLGIWHNRRVSVPTS
jgi:hypothetical protein